MGDPQSRARRRDRTARRNEPGVSDTVRGVRLRLRKSTSRLMTRSRSRRRPRSAVPCAICTATASTAPTSAPTSWCYSTRQPWPEARGASANYANGSATTMAHGPGRGAVAARRADADDREVSGQRHPLGLATAEPTPRRYLGPGGGLPSPVVARRIRRRATSLLLGLLGCPTRARPRAPTGPMQESEAVAPSGMCPRCRQIRHRRARSEGDLGPCRNDAQLAKKGRPEATAQAGLLRAPISTEREPFAYKLPP